MHEKSVSVPGISCGHCVGTIEREIGEVEGVRTVRADATTKRVEIAWEAPAEWPAIAALLAEIGYPPDES